MTPNLTSIFREPATLPLLQYKLNPDTSVEYNATPVIARFWEEMTSERYEVAVAPWDGVSQEETSNIDSEYIRVPYLL